MSDYEFKGRNSAFKDLATPLGFDKELYIGLLVEEGSFSVRRSTKDSSFHVRVDDQVWVLSPGHSKERREAFTKVEDYFDDFVANALIDMGQNIDAEKESLHRRIMIHQSRVFSVRDDRSTSEKEADMRRFAIDAFRVSSNRLAAEISRLKNDLVAFCQRFEEFAKPEEENESGATTNRSGED